jgi:hypothetical protein
MELLVLLITLPLLRNRTCGATTGTVKCTYNCDTIDENNETLLLLWNCFGYWNNQ